MLELSVDGVVEKMSCAWLVDCRGRGRRVASGIGVERTFVDRQIAFHARFRPARGAGVKDDMEEDRDSRTFVESMECGWLHTALLPGGERIVTLFTDADSPWIERARTRHGFTALVGDSVHVARILAAHRYGIATEPHATDARCSRLERVGGDGWLAAGDAATAYDPLGSYGILFAIHSGLRAAEAIVSHCSGDTDAPARYAASVTARFEQFLAERARYYRYEQRWSASPYWQRRGDEVSVAAHR
jgi:hypothetical protein